MKRLRFLSLAASMTFASLIDTKRVTKEFLESEIADITYQRLSGTLTHCTITTHDGFTFTGESACVDPAQFDEEIGKQIAYEVAFNKMYMPYGFWLHKILQYQNQAEGELSEDELSEDELSELEADITYMANCASLEDLTILLEDGLDDGDQAQKAIAIVKEYFKDEADTLVAFGNA